MSREQEGALDVFVSYAHEDEDLCDELRKQLTILEREGKIRSWHDRGILPGKEWKGEIDVHLNAADLILLLVSRDFMASEYCFEVELPRALERHRVGAARVVPIILRAVDWSHAPFAKLQILPTDARPVTSWPNRDEAFLNIQQGLRKTIDSELRRRGVGGERPRPSAPAPPAAPSSPPPRRRAASDVAKPRPERREPSAAPPLGGGVAARLSRRAWVAIAALAVLVVLIGIVALQGRGPSQSATSQSVPSYGFLPKMDTIDNKAAREGDRVLRITETTNVYDKDENGELDDDDDHLVGQWQPGTRVRVQGELQGTVRGNLWMECERIE